MAVCMHASGPPCALCRHAARHLPPCIPSIIDFVSIGAPRWQALQLCDDERWLHDLALELALELGFTSKWFFDQRLRSSG
jgi:hypothetical protein